MICVLFSSSRVFFAVLPILAYAADMSACYGFLYFDLSRLDCANTVTYRECSIFVLFHFLPTSGIDMEALL